MRLRGRIFAAALCWATACGGEAPSSAPALAVRRDTVPIRVLWVVNPRYPSPLDDSPALLARFAAAAEKYLDQPVEFQSVGTTDPKSFFEEARRRDRAMYDTFLNCDLVPYIYDENTSDSVLPWLESVYRTGFSRFETSVLFGFAREVLPEKKLQSITTRDGLAYLVASHHLASWLTLMKEPASDGRYFLEDYPATSNMAWWAGMNGRDDFDLIITNQIIASIEMVDNIPIHTGLRRGVSFGLGGYSPAKPLPSGFHRPLLVTTFWREPPPPILRFVGEATGDTEAWKEGVAAVFAHELAHAYLDWDEHYDHPGCIINPCRGFDMPGWVRGLRPHRCEREHKKIPF